MAGPRFQFPVRYCSRCGDTLKILAVIERPAIVRQIRSAEPLDLRGALSGVERLATKPRPPGPARRCAYPASAARSYRGSGG